MSANLLRLRPGALFNSFFWFLDIKLGKLLFVERWASANEQEPRLSYYSG
jgi:hypothetical protein